MKNIFTLYKESWKNIFKTTGDATAREYWTFMIIWLVGALLAALFCILMRKAAVTPIPFFVLLALLTVSCVPMVTLTIRRLHTVQKSGGWAFLLLFIGLGTLVVMLLCSGIFMAVSANHNPHVYGPPEWFEPTKNQNADVYGPPEWFEPSENNNECVYGPPEWFEPETAEQETAEPEIAEPEMPESEEEKKNKPEETAEPAFEPSENEPVDVYGPPEWFEPTKNVNEPVYGPPEWFEPETNIPEEVYGPPEMLETRNGK